MVQYVTFLPFEATGINRAVVEKFDQVTAWDTIWWLKDVHTSTFVMDPVLAYSS